VTTRSDLNRSFRHQTGSESMLPEFGPTLSKFDEVNLSLKG